MWRVIYIVNSVLVSSGNSVLDEWVSILWGCCFYCYIIIIIFIIVPVIVDDDDDDLNDGDGISEDSAVA